MAKYEIKASCAYNVETSRRGRLYKNDNLVIRITNDICRNDLGSLTGKNYAASAALFQKIFPLVLLTLLVPLVDSSPCR
jgi:hypothetical protein